MTWWGPGWSAVLTTTRSNGYTVGSVAVGDADSDVVGEAVGSEMIGNVNGDVTGSVVGDADGGVIVSEVVSVVIGSVVVSDTNGDTV